MDRRRFLRGAGNAVVAAPVLALGLSVTGPVVASAGLTGESKEIDWEQHKTKIGDPLRDLRMDGWKAWHLGSKYRH